MDLRLFSPNQREVVEAGEGPLSVLAGPGSGKTTVLAGRIGYLVEVRASPERDLPRQCTLTLKRTEILAARG